MVRAFLCAVLVYGVCQAQDAGSLRERHAALEAQLASSAFGRALHVQSTADGGAHKGQVSAVIERPYDEVAPALAQPGSWCDILKLQVNVKRCHAHGDEALTAWITRRARDALDEAYRVDFRFERAAASADYLHVALGAADGPVGTRDYQIRLEAAPLDAQRTFVRMSYAYTLGFWARMAMDAYLSTGAGRDKRGFTVDGGERGVVERSAMRHFLAIEAYLESLAEPPAERLEARLRRWYAAISRYPQLREVVSAAEYLEMKLRG
jgi:hypothetical protein